VATVFVDHYSWLKYVHLMTKLTSEETKDAKQAFEHFAKQHGVRILHYHCDNGCFADNAFKNSGSAKGQRLTFCGVNAHFQNGIAEKAIRDLRESARKQLLHARQRWPAAIHLALWPYALRSAVSLHNTLPVFGGWDLKARMLQFHQNWQQDEVSSCLWLVTTRMPRGQFGFKSVSRKKRLFGIKPTYWVCLTTVSLLI
jgi:hypothetical protein